jgi:beta-carotene 3-hydroxylase
MTTMTNLVLIVVLCFIGMEFVSYLLHRFVYHGLLWVFHKSHHEPRRGIFERNDVFPVVLAGITITLMILGLANPGKGELVAASIGITAYGAVYFFVHDLYVHRRARRLSLRIPFLLNIKRAHAIHHRYGGEPYGLLLFFHPGRVSKVQIDEDEAV